MNCFLQVQSFPFLLPSFGPSLPLLLPLLSLLPFHTRRLNGTEKNTIKKRKRQKELLSKCGMISTDIFFCWWTQRFWFHSFPYFTVCFNYFIIKSKIFLKVSLVHKALFCAYFPSSETGPWHYMPCHHHCSVSSRPLGSQAVQLAWCFQDVPKDTAKQVEQASVSYQFLQIKKALLPEALQAETGLKPPDSLSSVHVVLTNCLNAFHAFSVLKDCPVSLYRVYTHDEHQQQGKQISPLLSSQINEKFSSTL